VHDVKAAAAAKLALLHKQHAAGLAAAMLELNGAAEVW